VIRRFQIEDLVIQDASGVVFRALDTETGRTVAVRRFFPFGANGGGLLDDEQTAYDIALGRLAGLNHPALRSVICGGCDPVDGIPFIATEWIDGVVLHSILKQGPLAAEVAVELLTQALEVCELLSHVLAEEAVWVENDSQTIVLGSGESGRGFTFWISPLKWLGSNEQARGLESIISLTEEIMGWKGRMVNDQAGRGLGAWLKWLRGAAPTTTLREVRENLAAAVGADPPPPARRLVAAAIRPRAGQTRQPSSKTSLLLIVGLGLVGIGLGGWLLTRNRPEPEIPPILFSPAHTVTLETDPPSAPPPLPEYPASGRPGDSASLNERAAALMAEAVQADRAREATLAAQQADLEKQGGVFSPAQRELLAAQKGRTVTLEGRVEKIHDTGRTLYLLFSAKPDENEPRGAVVLKNAPAGLSKESLEPLIGKKVRFSGKVKVRKIFGNERPEVEITSRAAIQAAE
jgi:hypothetical protein